MDLGPHAGFILAAYAAALIVVLLLTAWLIADHRAQLRTLAGLEQRGIARRSAASGGPPRSALRGPEGA